ncbi:MAG: sodium ion-translocating decarboxylase subunit beta [Synergistetes bacterium]|nr:sodium ion-translocating decarboxylase subunit beta [Synergistota bacterium]
MEGLLAKAAAVFQMSGFAGFTWGNLVMIMVGGLLLWFAIAKGFEPLLLVPIGSGCILANLPLSGIMEPGGLFYYLFFGTKHEIYPCLIFLGVGALTDFGPLLANPITFILGAAAQLGVFVALIGAMLMGFTIKEAASIGIIGGADGPTSIYLAVKLAPQILGPIAVAAYSYMSLVPLIQPPVIYLLTTPEERKMVMEQLRPVSKLERILFPILTMIVVGLILPASVPLIGLLMFGNLLRECGVTERLSKTAQNELINIVTIMLGLTVGATMEARSFLTVRTIEIILLGLIAFMASTAGGVLFGKLLKVLTKGKVNPIIGAAGVSAVPMAARVCQRVAQKENPSNFLLMHAMGPNVAGVIGTAVAAGVMLSVLQ